MCVRIYLMFEFTRLCPCSKKQMLLVACPWGIEVFFLSTTFILLIIVKMSETVQKLNYNTINFLNIMPHTCIKITVDPPLISDSCNGKHFIFKFGYLYIFLLTTFCKRYGRIVLCVSYKEFNNSAHPFRI